MTAIITKNGTGVPPSEALQKGELAVDLDGLKLYTSTDGTDVVEVSRAPEVGSGAWKDNGGWISIDAEPSGGYSVNWSYSDGEENYLWCYEVDCKEVGGEIGYFTEFASDKVEIGTAPAGFSASKEKFIAKRSENGIAVPMAEGDTPLVVHGKIQANDLVDADGNSLLGGGSDGPDFTMDAYGTATTTITHNDEEVQVGVGHWYEEEEFGGFNYWLKKDFFEEVSGDNFANPIYHILMDGWTFSWMGESCGSAYADFETLYGEEIAGETCVIGTAPEGRSAKRQKVLEARAKYTGYQVPFADDAGTDTPLIVHGKIQANDLVDAEGTSLLGGGGLPAEFDSAFEYGDPWKGDIEEPGPMWIVQDGGLSASWIHTDNHLSAKTASFHTVKAVTIDTHAPNYGSVSTAAGFFTEATVFGGINITALDQDRPDLPFDLSDEEADAFKAKNRSIQYAFTVTHETLGRTVEIDKEGVIRANAFTDMEGNPIGGNFEMPEVIDGGTY